jgi:uncharacterized protein (TIGR03086 family)
MFKHGSDWTAEKVAAAKGELDAQTPCDGWKVRDLINHLIQGNRHFKDAARGKQAPPPQGQPDDVMGDDPVAEYKKSRNEMLAAYQEPGVLEKMGASLGMMFVEQLVHGWDLAKATDQDADMPDDLAEAAFQMIDGRMATDEQRGGFFAPEVKVPDDASAQEKLLAYAGRKP